MWTLLPKAPTVTGILSQTRLRTFQRSDSHHPDRGQNTLDHQRNLQYDDDNDDDDDCGDDGHHDDGDADDVDVDGVDVVDNDEDDDDVVGMANLDDMDVDSALIML